jgi:hypothetical protein
MSQENMTCKVIDQVWMILCPGNTGAIYEIGTSAKEAWEKVISKELMGTGVTKSALQKKGYRGEVKNSPS